MKTSTETIYSKADRFAMVAKKSIMTGNISRAKKCLTIAEKIFEEGSQETKNAISNVFVYSISLFMEIHKCNIKNLFPKHLLNEYSKQVNANGI